MRFRYKCCPTNDVEISNFSYLWLSSKYCKEVEIEYSSVDYPSEDSVRALMKVTEEAVKNEYLDYTVHVVKCDLIEDGSKIKLNFLYCLVPHDILRKLKNTSIRKITVVFLNTNSIEYKFHNQMPDSSYIYSYDTIIDMTIM
jgi:hypothetical protein